MIDKNSKIFLAGHNGFVGKNLLKDLRNKNYSNILTAERNKLNLLEQYAVSSFLKQHKPDYVIICAAKVGGILPNSQKPAEFFYENLQIQANLIHGAYLAGITNLIFLASSCIFPRNCQQPIKEEYLYSGQFEPTNYGYAVAKSAGVTMCKAYNEQYNVNYKSLNPCNLYGIGDNFTDSGHALAAILRKCHLAKVNRKSYITLWGTGVALREWLFVKDFADIIEKIMSRNDITESFINVGVGKEISILDLTKLIQKIIGYECEIKFDNSVPDGMLRKTLDLSIIEQHQIKAQTKLEEGIKQTYQWFLDNIAEEFN